MVAEELSKYTNVVVTPESQFKEDLINHGRHVSKWKNLWKLKAWGIKYEDIIYEYTANKISEKEFLELLVARYAESKKFNIKVNEIIWVDHTPSNIFYLTRLENILEVQSAVYVYRDPRAVFNSIKKLPWGPNTPGSLADMWLSTWAAALAKQDEKVLFLKYEEFSMVKDKVVSQALPELTVTTSENVCFDIPQYSKGQHSLVGKPFDDSRVNAWKKSLSSYEVRVIENKTHELLLSCGYETTSSGMKKLDDIRLKIIDTTLESLLSVLNVLRKKLRNSK